jgi:hypothetical protein
MSTLASVFRTLWERINQPEPPSNNGLRRILAETLAEHVSVPDETERFVIASLLLGPLPCAEVGIYWRDTHDRIEAPVCQASDTDADYESALDAYYAMQEEADVESQKAAEDALDRLINQGLVRSYEEDGLDMVACTDLVLAGGFVAHD